MHKSLKILSDLTTYTKYARYLPVDHRRETWTETVGRYIEMLVKKYPQLADEIYSNAHYIINKESLPSMRGLQFAGLPIEINNSRIYNCSYAPIDSLDVFSEIMFLLLSGCGVGISVQKHHVNRLPELVGPNKRTKKHLISDNIVGWADAVKALFNSYFNNKALPRFDPSDIRPKGTPLKTAGGLAPGEQPLMDCLHNVKKVFDAAISERGTHTKLKTVEAYDIVCYIAEAVMAGGIRRASLLALFTFNDNDMMNSKVGDWYIMNPQRQMANNTVNMLRHKAKKKDFDALWERIKASGSGDPGLGWSTNKENGFNPCFEIGLKPNQFCNVTTINESTVTSQEDLNGRVTAAAFYGTLQASFTDFHYLRDVWQETTEKDALIAVSMTGVANKNIDNYNLEEAADLVVKENIRIANIIGINPASRVTTIKPEGTVSCVVGSSSGIHGWEAPYYIRRMRFNKGEPIYNYLKRAIPHLVEDEFFDPQNTCVVSIPIKAPDDAVFKTEGAMSLMSRVFKFHKEWITAGHIKGENTNNVSATITIKPEEWDDVGKWMWERRDEYNGLAILPYDGGNYKQPPFQEITEAEYIELEKHVRNIDLTKVKEDQDLTIRQQEAACSGGQCEV